MHCGVQRCVQALISLPLTDFSAGLLPAPAVAVASQMPMPDRLIAGGIERRHAAAGSWGQERPWRASCGERPQACGPSLSPS